MTSLSCPACAGAPLAEPIHARDMFFGTREPFTYRRCAACGTLWIESVPEDLAPHYGDGYYLPGPAPQGGPLVRQRSYAVDPARSPFSGAELQAFAARTRELNAVRDGDAAGFVLRPR